jgi:hypothetical protein
MKYIYAILALLIFSACEKTLDDTVIPYVEQLVVFSVLEPGTQDLQLQISKTVPVLGVYNPEDAIISNVKGFITDGKNTWNVVYVSGVNYEVKGFEGVPGQSYELFLEWQGKKVNSVTTIPNPTEIYADNYYLFYEPPTWEWDDYGSYYLMGHLAGSRNYVYQTYYENDYYSYYGDYFTLPSGRSVVTLEEFWDRYENLIQRKYELTLSITDIAYYDYLEELSGNNDDFDFFSIGGLNVDWNVKGEGIGMFVGRNYWKDTVDLGGLKVVN